MNVLVLFECSGEVRRAFAALGHNAASIDIQEAQDGADWTHSDIGSHLQGRVEDFLEDTTAGDWDLIIAHPPCTALAVSGNAWYGEGKPKHAERKAAIEYTVGLWGRIKQLAPKVCLENPVGVLTSKGGMHKPQYIQPWMFGHPESKKTGLWLHGLPDLKPTNVLNIPRCGYWGNQTPSGQNKLGPSENRAGIRSKTYSGIAKAMAEQWSEP